MFNLLLRPLKTFYKARIHCNVCVFSKGVSHRARAGYFTHVHKYLLFEEDQFRLTFSTRTDLGKQCSHCLLDKRSRERFMYRWIKTETYPYFSASSRASSSLTALWSDRSHLLPHRTMSGFSQYAWICNWPEKKKHSANYHVFGPILMGFHFTPERDIINVLYSPEIRNLSSEVAAAGDKIKNSER